ncbi:MAG: hypothetical protein IJA97_05845 [Clostridia bacterium]|nr:hypothetical protein [Clostridia bacterium]
MKAYYIIGVVVSFLLAIIMFAVAGIGNCSIRNKEKKRIEGFDDVYSVRYFVSDEDDAAVKYDLVESGDYFNVNSSAIPSKEGFIFAGFYNTPEYDEMGAQMYVDSMGKGVIAITGDIVLYPIFIDENLEG